MVIKINIHNEIVWPVMGFLLLSYYGISGQWLFILSVVWLIYLSVRNHSLVATVPRIYGFPMYMVFAIVAGIIGLMTNNTRDVAKDIFYTFPAIIIMMIGYLYNKYDKNDGKSITKTLYISGFLITVCSFVSLMAQISSVSDLSVFRNIMGNQVYETTLIFAIMLSEKVIGKKIIFSRMTDMIILVMLMLKGIVSLGRTELIVTFLMIAVILLLNIYFSENKNRSVTRLITLAILLAAAGFAVFRILPSDIRAQFIDKLQYSFEEVDSNAEYDSTEEAMNHWRAYEMECASKQWMESNVAVQLLGAGFGEYIKIQYIPHNFTGNMVVDNGIALLHNSYYSILVKGGLLGIAAILWLYISNATLIFRKKYRREAYIVSAMCAITVAMMIYTYVVTGIFSQTVKFVWPFMIGWFNGKIRSMENDTRRISDETHEIRG